MTTGEQKFRMEDAPTLDSLRRGKRHFIETRQRTMADKPYFIAYGKPKQPDWTFLVYDHADTCVGGGAMQGMSRASAWYYTPKTKSTGFRKAASIQERLFNVLCIFIGLSSAGFMLMVRDNAVMEGILGVLSVMFVGMYYVLCWSLYEYMATLQAVASVITAHESLKKDKPDWLDGNDEFVEELYAYKVNKIMEAKEPPKKKARGRPRKVE